MHSLFVIEAPGKIKQMESILQSLGEDAIIQATKGHIYTMPESLSDLGIDSTFYEYAREPRDNKVVYYLRDRASSVERVYIATDADEEGDAIAWDVAELLRDIHPEPLRVRLKGMDEDSVRSALDAVEPIKKHDAIPARTRAILDRMIGHTFSQKGVPVGRVRTALLGLVKNKKPAVEKVKLAAPAEDGGRPWVCEIPVSPPLSKSIAEKLIEIPLPRLSMKMETNIGVPPDHMGDIMVKAGDRLDMSPKETETSMQRLYESGRLSYPRSGSKGMSSSVSKKMQDIIKKSGYRYDNKKVEDKNPNETHDSPYPIGKIDVNKNPEKLGSDEGVRTLIARNLVKTGIGIKKQTADAKKITKSLAENSIPNDVIKIVIEAEWTREQSLKYPDRESWPESKIITRRSDVVLLEAAVEQGLGKPSTWANHIENFMSQGLVDDHLNLTSKGEFVTQNSPPALLDPRMSAAIEKACEQTSQNLERDPGREPWEVLAERIVKALPEPLKAPLTSSIQDISPKDRVAYDEHVKVALDAFEQPSQAADMSDTSLTDENAKADL